MSDRFFAGFYGAIGAVAALGLHYLMVSHAVCL
jgi:hypothetical protein